MGHKHLMRAMVLAKAKEPLTLQMLTIPSPSEEEVLVRIAACGVCRTDLHILDGELQNPKLPLVMGHQIVGVIERVGGAVKGFAIGDRIGIPWLGGSCGACAYCRQGRENLCDHARYTGYHIDGGFAEYCLANSRFIFPIPETYKDLEAAPLLCAGLIGFRSLKMTEGAKKIGFYGFGASAHLLVQVVNYWGGEVYAFVRESNKQAFDFAKKMGAAWVGTSKELAPTPLDAAIIFAPAGELIPTALKAVKKGGIVVCAGIHMSDIPSFPYSLLWEERILRSVANLTRKDGEEFLSLAPRIPIKTTVNLYPLEKANQALEDLRHGRFEGSAVIQISNFEI